MFDICLLLYGDWKVFLVNVYVFIYFLYSFLQITDSWNIFISKFLMTKFELID